MGSGHQRNRSNLIGRDFDGRREGQSDAGAPEDRKVDSRDMRG